MTEKGDIIFSYTNSDENILVNLGKQLKQMRLNKNYTQKQLSELSGLSRSAISDFENKGSGSMKSFVQLLRSLEKLELLNHFISEALVSPIQVAKLKGKMRKRASGTINLKNNKEESEW
ncbi:putative transcriptional regulator [Dysgonomonas sp. PFB1-18]|uniref:helix-turn-helix domain-containing protein n=1 Tax=unclassified Dysgonomonas TaxID=2630389 RepID=UPI0013D767B3|nr:MULTISPECIES: helix-turn-helix domain-containing protein [unclassified Dysgonomonas]MDH6310078.1 putative transcriptional regulator [Dysgonomonas sp. PF1-14]MDH6339987.1 putative transcriptional regulator [Dysgonomonas sp. PF1-16]MDH6381635.1 putative transcriptional regulator [Dysgonomonas sp. PFB1-18]MDH6398727.1 putative transcriptional regulator [Dysgonomonas sp. PF1-23]NDV93573.1 helix-turn-helix domain-containing protein [Dysgonomonas sp. 521]